MPQTEYSRTNVPGFKEHLKKHPVKQQDSHHDSLVRSSCRGVGDLHHQRGSPQSRWMRMMPGRWGFWISSDSLVIWVDAFLLGPWSVSGVCGSSWPVLLLACLALWTFCWWAL